jgi:flagellar protein FlaF
MHKAAKAYAKTAQKTGNPRELEAQLLLRAAAKLQAVKDGDVTANGEIVSAIRYNRRLWLVFANAIGRSENPLPREIKQNVANLAVFVVKHSMSIETSTEPVFDHLGVLININRELAAGLRAKAA